MATVREPLVILDDDLRVIFANASFFSTFKVSPEETLGRFIFDLGNRQWDIPELKHLLRETILRGTPFEDFLVKHDFERIGQKVMALNARPIKRKGERLILLAIEDITERYTAEERFRRLYKVLYLINAVHRLISPHKEKVEFLQEVCRTFTGTKDFLGAQVYLFEEKGERLRPVAKAGSEEAFESTKEVIPQLLERVVEERRPIIIEGMEGKPSGVFLEEKKKKRLFSIGAFPLFVKGPLGVFIFITEVANAFREEEREYLKEVTEDIALALDLIEAERRLEESKRRYQAIFKGAPDIMGIIDREGRILALNRRIEEELGWKVEELLGKDLRDMKVLTEQSVQVAHSHLMHLLNEEVIPPPFEIECMRKDGTIVPYEVNAFPLNYGGEASEIQFIMRNISLRKEAEEAIRTSKERLREVLFGATKALIGIIEERDPYTRGHSEGVARLAVAIGQRMGLSHEEITGLYIAGLLHDVGKVAIPLEILVKPGKLEEKEIALIREHPTLGYEVLKEIDFPWPVALVALQHHERLDGSGYPKGLKGKEITLEARIIAVADVLDAMSHHRPYRPARKMEEVIDELRKGRGRLYDEKVVDICLDLLRESPDLLGEQKVKKTKSRAGTLSSPSDKSSPPS